MRTCELRVMAGWQAHTRTSTSRKTQENAPTLSVVLNHPYAPRIVAAALTTETTESVIETRTTGLAEPPVNPYHHPLIYHAWSIGNKVVLDEPKVKTEIRDRSRAEPMSTTCDI